MDPGSWGGGPPRACKSSPKLHGRQPRETVSSDNETCAVLLRVTRVIKLVPNDAEHLKIQGNTGLVRVNCMALGGVQLRGVQESPGLHGQCSCANSLLA